MPLQGEQAWHAWAYTTGGSYHSASWSLDFPPGPKFIKVSLGSYYEFDDKSAVAVGLIRIRRRLANGADETINFPDIDAFDPVMVQFNNTMTHVTFGIKVKHAYGLLVWTLGSW
jgi:hypothetical protein